MKEGEIQSDNLIQDKEGKAQDKVRSILQQFSSEDQFRILSTLGKEIWDKLDTQEKIKVSQDHQIFLKETGEQKLFLENQLEKLKHNRKDDKPTRLERACEIIISNPNRVALDDFMSLFSTEVDREQSAWDLMKKLNVKFARRGYRMERFQKNPPLYRLVRSESPSDEVSS